MNKLYIDANQLLENSFQLAKNIYDSGFEPTALIALWRGGTPIGIAVQEGLAYLDIHTKHFALRTSYYNDKNERNDAVQIDNFGIIAEQIHANDQLLIVDDVFDSGNTVSALINKIQSSNAIPTPNDIRIATPYYKPKNNLTNLKPDYFLHETNKWIVFPHELHGLSTDEILKNKPAAHSLITE
jgi:hypoxanthine phosphoribosyltransferase